MKSENKLKLICVILIGLMLFWVALTTAIQRFKCDKLTETQLLKRTPESVMCNWQVCD